MGPAKKLKTLLESEREKDFVKYKKQNIVTEEQAEIWRKENEEKRKAENEIEEKMRHKFKMSEKFKRYEFLKAYEKLCKKFGLIVRNVSGCVCTEDEYTIKDIDSDYEFIIEDEYCEFIAIQLKDK